MIPKIIHYCWYGNNQKPELVLQCIESWKAHNPDYQIVEWNKENSPSHPIITKNLKDKLWAYASDYTRLYTLYEYGGIYLDTDIFIIRSLNSLLGNNCFVAFQYKELSDYWITNGAFGSAPKHHFIKKCLDELEKKGHSKLNPYISPRLTTTVLNNLAVIKTHKEQYVLDIKILTAESFYPLEYEQARIMELNQLQSMKSANTYGIHLFLHSWKKESTNYSFIQRLLIFTSKTRSRIKRLLQ